MIASFIARALNKVGLINRYETEDLIPISKLNITLRIKINDAVFKIPVMNKTGWENLFLTEGWFNALLKFLNVNKNWTIIDIGANIGQTLIKVKSIDREISYFGFEPNPVCVNYLYKLIDKNNLKKTTLLPVGVSNRTGLFTFFYYTDSETDPSASIIPDYRPESGIRKIKFGPVFNINEVSQIIELNEINLIKIDVEGAELEVLLSCEEIIRKHRPFIIIEILPVYTSENLIRLERQREIEKFIKKIGYKIFMIKKGVNESFDKLEGKETIGIHGNIINIDYLLTPSKVD
jgi:FkbM family methyltransferase